MKITSFLLGCLIAAILPTAAFALTIDVPVSAAYVREHPKEWSVKVSKKENGLIQFTIVRFLSEPKYLVAHLAVHRAGKVIAESDSPAVGQKGDNTFYVALAPEDLVESKFEISESSVSILGDQVIPSVGSIIHQFRLLEFVPENLLKPAPKK